MSEQGSSIEYPAIPQAPELRLGRGLSEAARRIGVHSATMIRWIRQGVRLADGSRLPLSATRIPGRWLVADADVDSFIEKLTLDRRGTSPESCRALPPAATSRASLAGQILDSAGIS